MIQQRKYLRAIGGRREEAKRSGGADGAENLLPDFGQVHGVTLREEERSQEQNPRQFEAAFAQFTAIEEYEWTKGKWQCVGLHFNWEFQKNPAFRTPVLLDRIRTLRTVSQLSKVEW